MTKKQGIYVYSLTSLKFWYIIVIIYNNYKNYRRRLSMKTENIGIQVSSTVAIAINKLDSKAETRIFTAEQVVDAVTSGSKKLWTEQNCDKGNRNSDVASRIKWKLKKLVQRKVLIKKGSTYRVNRAIFDDYLVETFEKFVSAYESCNSYHLDILSKEDVDYIYDYLIRCGIITD